MYSLGLNGAVFLFGDFSFFDPLLLMNAVCVRRSADFSTCMRFVNVQHDPFISKLRMASSVFNAVSPIDIFLLAFETATCHCTSRFASISALCFATP